jgi:hypothetical protein
MKPNCSFSDTASVSAVSTLTRRRDTKRREVCESELKELLQPLFPLVRFPHVLPRDKSSEVLDLVLARNLYPGNATRKLILKMWIVNIEKYFQFCLTLRAS